MSGRTPEEDAQAAVLSAAMRAIRKNRRMRPSEVAEALGMPVRSYEHFEAGRGRMTFDRVLRFADATGSDAVALLAVVPLGAPEFALRCADNKLMTILLLALAELDKDLGDDITYLSSATLVSAFTRLTKDLTESVRKRDTFAETWLQERGVRVAAPRPFDIGWKRKPAS